MAKNSLLFQEELYNYMELFDRVPSGEELEEMAMEQGVQDELPIVLKIDKKENEKSNIKVDLNERN